MPVRDGDNMTMTATGSAVVDNYVATPQYGGRQVPHHPDQVAETRRAEGGEAPLPRVA